MFLDVLSIRSSLQRLCSRFNLVLGSGWVPSNPFCNEKTLPKKRTQRVHVPVEWVLSRADPRVIYYPGTRLGPFGTCFELWRMISPRTDAMIARKGKGSEALVSGHQEQAASREYLVRGF